MTTKTKTIAQVVSVKSVFQTLLGIKSAGTEAKANEAALELLARHSFKHHSYAVSGVQYIYPTKFFRDNPGLAIKNYVMTDSLSLYSQRGTLSKLPGIMRLQGTGANKAREALGFRSMPNQTLYLLRPAMLVLFSLVTSTRMGFLLRTEFGLDKDFSMEDLVSLLEPTLEPLVLEPEPTLKPTFSTTSFPLLESIAQSDSNSEVRACLTEHVELWGQEITLLEEYINAAKLMLAVLKV